MTISTMTHNDQTEVRHECRVTVNTCHHAPVVRVIGRLDWATAGPIRDALHAQGREPAIVIDLSSMTSVDSAGVGVILTCLGRTLSRGGRVVVVATDSGTLEVLRAVQVPEVVPVVASIEDATLWLATSSTVSDGR